MARLHEFQGKALLKEHEVLVPRGKAVTSPEEAKKVAAELDCPVVLKVQAWTTSRKAQGGILFADTPEEAAQHAKQLLGMTFGNFPVSEVLVEEKLTITHEIFVSLSIDDAAQSPVLLLDCAGGSGIEDRADTVARIPINPLYGADKDSITHVVEQSRVFPEMTEEVVTVICNLVDLARKFEARGLEINPLVITEDLRTIAADCRITIDDYAVFRHPELGIEIARELDHPATELGRAAAVR